MFRSPLFWLVVVVLLAAAPGWYLSQLNQQHKAEERARVEYERHIEKIQYEKKRELAAQNRNNGVGLQFDMLVLKGADPLQNVKIIGFNEDGITFATASGASRVFWSQLPDELVGKYRDPLPPVQRVVTSGGDTADSTDATNSAAEEEAAAERTRIELQRQRDTVSQNRAAAIDRIHAVVLVKGKKPLEHAMVKAFNDNGITFETNGGIARVTWDELPDDWVAKYREPGAAEQGVGKAGPLADQLSLAESLGREVQVSFVREFSEQGTDIAQRGCLVKVLSVNKQGWKDANGQNIFVMSLGRVTFEGHPVYTMRVYPTGRRIVLTSGVVVTNDRQRIPFYVNTPDQALQFSRAAGVNLADLPKDQW
jgi:hypothetical protein